MTRIILFGLMFGVVNSALAFDVNPNTAVRDPNVSYLEYKSRALSRIQQESISAGALTPIDSAKRFKNSKLPAAATWDNLYQLREMFEKVRDYRWLIEANRPNFLRRPSWLFPDDGCFARAALSVRTLMRWNMKAPSKVFAFGDLSAKTSNTSQGYVTWWYHVAPMVEVDGQKFVLDPSLDAERPINLREWLGRMSENPDEVEVSLCKSGAYTPYDRCDRETDGEEAWAQRDQQAFLQMEWRRLEELHRNPVKELGDNPPWKP